MSLEDAPGCPLQPEGCKGENDPHPVQTTLPGEDPRGPLTCRMTYSPPRHYCFGRRHCIRDRHPSRCWFGKPFGVHVSPTYTRTGIAEPLQQHPRL